MPKLHFGHCIGCDQPIPPPYLSFVVSQAVDGDTIWNWEEVDVCNACAAKLTADDLHGLVQMLATEEAEAAHG